METDSGEETKPQISPEEKSQKEYEEARKRFQEWLDQRPFDIETAFKKIPLKRIYQGPL